MSEGGSGSESIFSSPPPGIEVLIRERGPWSWIADSNRTGRFRWTQRSFDVNELVAGLGHIQQINDPFGLFLCVKRKSLTT